MIIFFTEEDVVSFGNFMLSEQRKKYITGKLEPDTTEEQKVEILGKVTNEDLQIWAQLINKKPENV